MTRLPVEKLGAGRGLFTSAMNKGANPEVWVRLPRHLGDVLFVMPFIHSLQRAWNAEASAMGQTLRWVALGHAGGAGLLSEADSSFFSELKLDEKEGKLDPLSLAWRWRRQRPPAAIITLGQSARLALAAWLGGVPVRAGIADNGLKLLYHAAVDYRDVDLHLSTRLQSLSRKLGIPAPHFRLLTTKLLGGTRVRSKLVQAGWNGAEPLVAFAPGTRGASKRWKPELEYWPELAGLVSGLGLRPVVLGTAEEEPIAQAMRAKAPSLLDLTGQTSLPEVAAVLEFAGSLIAVDTGVAHLAAAMGCATVTLFGPSHERFAQPVGPWSISLRGQPIDMAPGVDLVLKPHQEGSLARLSPLRVFQAFQFILNAKRSDPPIA